MAKTITNLRNWQIEAIQSGRQSRNFLLQAPGGAGKSLLQVMLAQADIEDTGNKQLILVPKNHIHHGFFDEDAIEFTLPTESHVSRWEVDSNFCEKSDNKTSLLKEFLLADVKKLRKTNRLAAIATHKAMASVWSKLTKAEKVKALKHLSCGIDEAHHISNVFHDFDLSTYNVKDQKQIRETATKLGKFINYALRNNDPTTKIRLATATFFRGDKQAILSKHFRESFGHFTLTWEEHFQTLGIEHLGLDYHLYKKDPIKCVLELVATEPDESHLIIIPALTHKWRSRSSLRKLLIGLSKFLPRNQILDLVTKSSQETNKRLLQENPNAFRVVVACRLFDEGTDWVPCTRMHNTDACEQSLTLAVQRFFRPLRKHPEKKIVQIYSYVPNFDHKCSIEQKRQHISDRVNAVLACVVTQGEIAPIMVNVNAGPTNRKKRKRSTLREVLGHEYESVISETLRRYENIEDKSNAAEVEKVVGKVVDKIELPDEVNKEEIRTALLEQVCRLSLPKPEFDPKKLRSHGIDAETIRKKGFDKVWETLKPKNSIISFGAENIDQNSIRELISLVKEIPTLDEIKEGIRKFYKRTGEKPMFHQTGWMDELGRSASAVDKILRRHYGKSLAVFVREVFGHLNDDLLTRTRELIREYNSRGIRLTRKMGRVRELDLTSFALDARLKTHFDTTIAAETEKLLGPSVLPLTLPKVKRVIRKYVSEGRKFPLKKGDIPELNTTGRNLSERVKRMFDVRTSELVKQIEQEICQKN